MKWMVRITFLLLGGTTLAFALLAYDVYSYPGELGPTVADTAIVLGAAIEDDQLSAAFRERIHHGIHLLNTGQVRWIILTGGRPDGCDHSESFIAKKYALQNGAPSDKILAEAESHTTYQNLHYAS